jgi:hypothetical protein
MLVRGGAQTAADARRRGGRLPLPRLLAQGDGTFSLSKHAKVMAAAKSGRIAHAAGDAIRPAPAFRRVPRH